MITPPTLLTNVRVHTSHPAGPVLSRVLVAGGRILAASGTIPSSARSVDCGGRLLLPGFVDPHVHLLSAAAAMRSVDCSPRAARSIAEVQQRLAEAARSQPSGWLRATGYDEAALAEGRHPTRWDLDAAVADRPVRLLHRGGHAAVLNSAALSLAGIDIGSEEPPGGVIDRRTGDGEPTGLLIDMDAVIERAVPPLSTEELVEGMRAFGEVLLRAGVTTVQDMTHRNDAGRLALIDEVCEASAFRPIRLAPATAPGVDGTGPVKLMLAEAAGLDRRERERVSATVWDAHVAGRQVAVHAATAMGVSLALDAIEAALVRDPRAGHRHRIEHASICPLDAAGRAAALGVVVVSNPVFLAERGEVYSATIAPEEQSYLYPTGMLIRSGVKVAAASDAPVAPSSPLDGVRAAMRRASRSGAALPGEPLGYDDAVLLVTESAAFAAFAEAEHGQIAPGQPANLVLLDGPPGEEETRVLWTVIGGEWVHRAGDSPTLI